MQSLLSEGLCMQKHMTIYETLKRIGDAEQRKLDTLEHLSSPQVASGNPISSPRRARSILSGLCTEPVHQSYFKLAVVGALSKKGVTACPNAAVVCGVSYKYACRPWQHL